MTTPYAMHEPEPDFVLHAPLRYGSFKYTDATLRRLGSYRKALRLYQVTSVERKRRFPWSVVSVIFHSIDDIAPFHRGWPFFTQYSVKVRPLGPLFIEPRVALFGPRKRFFE